MKDKVEKWVKMHKYLEREVGEIYNMGPDHYAVAGYIAEANIGLIRAINNYRTKYSGGNNAEIKATENNPKDITV